jgi:hypothetical protein
MDFNGQSTDGVVTPQQEQELNDVVIQTQYQTASSNITDFTGSLTVNGLPVGGGGGGGIEVGSKSDLLAKTGMSEGQQFYLNSTLGTSFTSQENKLYTYSGRTWQVIGETVELLCSEDMIEGNTVEVDTNNDYEIKKTNTSQDTQVIGVVALVGALAGEWVTVATRGIWGVACENDTYARAEYLTTDATDGLPEQPLSLLNHLLKC